MKTRIVYAAVILTFIAGLAFGAEKTVVAVSPLSASADLAEEKQTISDVMQAELSVSEKITLVDRERLRKALRELQLSQQGMISPESAKQIEKIVGAKYFCSGKVVQSGDKTLGIVKILDIETTIVKLAYSELEKEGDAVAAGRSLASDIEKLVAAFNAEKSAADGKAEAEKSGKAIPAEWKRPAVMVVIPEMHVRQQVLLDPAAENELIKRLLADGYEVVDSEYVAMMRNDPSNANRLFSHKKTAAEFAQEKGADILIYGEAISELAARLGEFEGCRGRVEIKAIRTDNRRILLADSAYGGATDLSETAAGKKAIQEAANKLADTFSYDLAEQWNTQ